MGTGNSVGKGVVIGMCPNWIAVAMAQLCNFTEAHQTTYITWVNFEVLKLYLNQGVFQTSELPLCALGVKT